MNAPVPSVSIFRLSLIFPSSSLFLFLLIFSVLASNPPQFCQETAECVAKIQRMALGTDRFWFGDQWAQNCGGHHRGRHARGNPVDCVNPAHLAPFASLGSRLFRVRTFTNAYLAQLGVFPRIRFQPQSGSYRACGHLFEIPPPSKDDSLFGLLGHPSARPIPAFHAQNVPTLNWPELRPNQSLVVAMIDVGFGQLNYLAVDFPRQTQVIRPYRSIDNFRPRQPTPLAILIFEPPNGEENITVQRIRDKWSSQPTESGEAEQFDLGQFMIENGLERGLIGLNWALIDGDPFGIERQRLRGMPDNCHSLVLQKLLRDHRWDFVESFALASELDSSLAVSVLRPRSSLQACCFSVSVEEEQLFLDPLADLQLPSVAFRHGPPLVTSIWPMEQKQQDTNVYQRSSRHYIVPFRDDRFSLVLFDPARHFVYWMLVDIPAEGLASGNLDASVPVAPYLAPVPALPGQCLFAVFMLFRQPGPGRDHSGTLADFFNSDHPLRQRQCQAHCAQRMDFDIGQFKALHRLLLSAVNWAKVCFDLFEAGHQISLIRKRPELREGVDRTSKLGGGGRGGKARGQKPAEGGDWRRPTTEWKSERERQIDEICVHFNKTEAAGGRTRVGRKDRREGNHCAANAAAHPARRSSALFGGLSITLALLISSNLKMR